ncbi:MAG: ABC transporter permease [Thermoanaerobaculum sp.]|nr:ABC transporter permease [Thermoanaerobaculum sp.]
MKAHLFRRFLASALVIWLVATATFFLISMAPGDLASKLADPRIAPSARERLREQFGLQDPWWERYLRWFSRAATGDFGYSLLFRRPVGAVLGEALPNTALLAGVGLALELVMGLAIGLIQAYRPHSGLDRLLSALTLTAYALPTFAVASGLLVLFAYTFPLFPPSHMASPEAAHLPYWARVGDTLRHLVLPALTIAITGCGAVARYLRGSLLDEQRRGYVLFALARGCSTRRALVVHALPNALLPLLTVIGLSLPFLVSGSLVIEVIFSWPGMGQVFYSAVTARDVPLIQACTVVITAAVVAGNWLADLAYNVADPRVRV